MGLPRVTGYLLLGLVCGPHVGNLITHEMARELGIFNGLAVAIIAFMATRAQKIFKIVLPAAHPMQSVSGAWRSRSSLRSSSSASRPR